MTSAESKTVKNKPAQTPATMQFTIIVAIVIPGRISDVFNMLVTSIKAVYPV